MQSLHNFFPQSLELLLRDGPLRLLMGARLPLLLGKGYALVNVR